MAREMKYTEIGEIPVEWELQTFEETFCVLSNNTLPRADLNNRGGTIRNVHYGDILTQFGEVLDCGLDEIPYLNDASLLTASAQVLQDGDVILADTAEDDTVGKATEVYGLGNGRMVAGLHTIPCRVKKGEFAPKWLGYYMNSHTYHDQVLPYITGIKVSSISKTAISETLIAVPPVEEQKAIVSAFSEVDQLIAELKKIVSKLQDFKRGCLYMMFPQDGSDIPQMREPEYTDTWEQRKVSEIAEIVAGGTPSTGVEKYWIPKEIPWLTSGEVHKKYIKFTDNMISYEGMNNSSAKMIREKSVLIALAGQGKTRGTVAINCIPLTTNQSIAAMTFNEDIIPEYIFYNLENRYDELRKMSSGDGSRGGLNKQLVGNIMIPYTSVMEQKHIGYYFKNLDHLITLHQRKLEKYAQIKKGMMSELITGRIKLV